MGIPRSRVLGLSAREAVTLGAYRCCSMKATLRFGTGALLVTTGRYGEITPDCGQTIHREIEQSEFAVFEQSSHLPHIQEPERFRSVVRDFLGRVEKPAAS